jgi:hypothetical protein
VQELRAGDLRQADGGDVAGVAAEGLVHLLVDALRFERHLVEVRLAQHVLLAVVALPAQALDPLGVRRLPFARDLDEEFQRRPASETMP